MPNHKERIRSICPLHRIGEPEDMADMAIYLASPAAFYVNGTVIAVDGGIAAR